MNDATPGIGSNSQSLYAAFLKQRDDVVALANRWLTAFKDKPITDEESASRCHDFIAKIKSVVDAIEEKRVELKKPVILEGKHIDEEAKETAQPLQAALAMLGKLELGYKQLLRQRQDEARLKAAEEARAAQAAFARLAGEADNATTVEQVVAAEKAQERATEAVTALHQAIAAKPIVRGDFATRGSGIRTIWSARIDDLGAATTYYLGTPFGRIKIAEVIQALADKDVKSIKQIAPGIPGVSGLFEER